jgi:hypothetical protein
MAIIKIIRNPINQSSLLEDPQPGSDNVFIQLDQYSKTTLNPVFNAGLVLSTNGTIGTSGVYGYSNVSDVYRIGGILQLNGETTHIRHSSFNTVNVQANNLDYSPFVSMDKNYKPFPIKYFTDGTNNIVISNYNYANPTSGTQSIYSYCFPVTWAKINTTPSDLANSGYITWVASSGGNFGSNVAGGTGCGGFPIYRNPVTNNLVWIAHDYWGDNNQYTSNYGWTPTTIIGAATTPAFSPSYSRQSVGINRNYTGQFMGPSTLDSYSLQMNTSVQYDYSHYFYKYNDGNNTYITLNSYTTQPYPSGTGGVGTYVVDRYEGSVASTTITGSGVGAASVTGFINGNFLTVTAVASGAIAVGQTLSGTGIITGTTVLAFTTSTITTGDRTSTFGQYIPKFASTVFTDTVTTTVTNAVGFYIPLVDVNGRYHPMYFNWDKTRDFIARYTDIGMYYTATNTTTNLSTYWLNDTYSGTSIDAQYGMQRCWYNETFLGDNGRRYLTFMQLHGAGGVADANEKQRTFMTYIISTSTYRQLTFHSNLVIPQTPKNICWLNDNRTLLSVICHNATYVYTWNTSTGWTNTASFPYQYNAIGRDNLGRVWAQDSGFTSYGRLHLLSGVPATVSVISTASTYNYAGTAIPTSFLVDAFDLTGTRMTATINLSVVGNSLKLTTSSGSTTYFNSLTVVTSVSTSTIVYGTVISNGYSNITTTMII